MQWEIVVGLEVHTQLSTKSKIFSGASTIFGALPNAQACLIDIGFPGVLPVLNRDAVERAIKFGLAVGATINPVSIFARKNYFYPDLPKGYQISQYELPVVQGGSIKIQAGHYGSEHNKNIRLTRAHLEEDAGKSLHEDFDSVTGIDFNRAGTPLLEIVSEPDMRSSSEAIAFAKTLHSLVRWIGICDGNMQEGSFRCDANVSVRRLGENTLGTRREIKNLNSFRFLQQAIDYEAQWQIDTLESGGKIQQATVLFDSSKRETRVMRNKENAQDYRYFPDPDLLPLEISQKWIEQINNSMPELPMQRSCRFMAHDTTSYADALREQFGTKPETNPDILIKQSCHMATINDIHKIYALSAYDAAMLTADITTADYFEEVVKIVGNTHAKLCANWVVGEIITRLNQESKIIVVSLISAQQLAGLLLRIVDGTISGKTAKDVLNDMWNSMDGVTADAIIETKNLKQVSSKEEIERIIDEIFFTNPRQVSDYRNGKVKAFNFFFGQVMKATTGKANPAQVKKILAEKLIA